MTNVQAKLIFPLDPFSSWLLSFIAFDLIAEVIPPCPCIRWIATRFFKSYFHKKTYSYFHLEIQTYLNGSSVVVDWAHTLGVKIIIEQEN
jgi:hypothetical protein